jgi:hypothetical protein
MMRRFPSPRRFLRDTGGSLSIEAAIMAPTLVFALFLIFTIFDIFRFDATNSKAAYTIGDLLSRETEGVDQAYINGLKDIFDYIVLNDNDTWIRVSVVRYDGDDDEFKLVWSHGNTGVTSLDSDTAESIYTVIPEMSEEDIVIVVETFMPYQMPFRVGIADFSFKNTVVTRPRFSSQLNWST